MSKKVIITLIAIICVWYGHSLFIESAEPVLASDAALMQMEDTTEGHVVSRAYLNKGRKTLQSSIIPLLITVFIIWFAFKPKSKKEEEASGNDAPADKKESSSETTDKQKKE